MEVSFDWSDFLFLIQIYSVIGRPGLPGDVGDSYPGQNGLPGFKGEDGTPGFVFLLSAAISPEIIASKNKLTQFVILIV